MQSPKALRAIRKRVKVELGRRVEITNLPFPAGSELDVIVTAVKSHTSKKSAESIYYHTAAVVQRKRIPHYSMTLIEEIIYQSRASHGTVSPN